LYSTWVITYIVLVEKHMQLSDRDAEVSLIKFIWDVPPKGTKLAPLLHQRVEKAQAEEQSLEGLLLKTQSF